MNELLQQIFNLETPIGRTIVYWIRIFFWVGVGNYIWHLGRLGYEYICLKFVQIKIKKGLDVVSPGLLNRLAKSVVIRTGIRVSIIYRRIRDLVNIKQNGGEIDHDVLGDIHAGATSRKAGLSNYILGILIILGLVGTLWGLTTAVRKVQPILQNIEDIDQLSQISKAIQETLSGMNTAFITTLAGLLASFGLGFCGWFFNLLNSAFLTRFETVVVTEIIPHFKQTPESALESSVDQLQVSVGEFKLATEDNVRRMQESIQQLTEKSWDAYLEQQYVIANELGEIPRELRESLGGISEYQVLIKSTVASFEKLTENFMAEISKNQSSVDAMVSDFKELTTQSMSQVSEYQKALQDGLENAVPRLEAEGKTLKEAIEAYQNSQSKFIDDLSSTLQNQLQSITDNQQMIVNVLIGLKDELHIRSVLEKQNQIFERIETSLTENQKEMVLVLSQSILEAQNKNFERIKTELTNNQQAIVDVLIRLADELQIRSVLETQNQVFGRIENHLIDHRNLVAEQIGLMQTLINILQHPIQTPPGGASPTPGSDLSQQISLKLDLLNTKIDVLNDTMRQPGIYRWIWEIRRWLGGSR